MRNLFEEKYSGVTNLEEVVSISEIKQGNKCDNDIPLSLTKEIFSRDVPEKYNIYPCYVELLIKGLPSEVLVYLGYTETPYDEYFEPSEAVKSEYQRLVAQWRQG
jgi:hypothetical protein